MSNRTALPLERATSGPKSRVNVTYWKHVAGRAERLRPSSNVLSGRQHSVVWETTLCCLGDNTLLSGRQHSVAGRQHFVATGVQVGSSAPPPCAAACQCGNDPSEAVQIRDGPTRKTLSPLPGG